MTSMQEKLQLVFPQFFQVKRVKKQIQQIIDNKQKYSYQPKISFSRGHSVTFIIQFTKNAFKKYKRLQNQKNFEIKILLKKQYPTIPPLIYCMSNNMIMYGLQPFRDYSEFLAIDWSPKFTSLDIVKVFLQFVDGWNIGSQQRKGKYKLNQFFQLDRIFSWSFLQTFPVKFVHPNKVTGGLLIISCQNEVILLEQHQSQNSYLTKDLIKIDELVSIFKSRQSTLQILLQIKKGQARYSLAFRSDDSENIVNYIIEYMKLVNSFGRQQSIQKEQSSDQQKQEENEQEEQSKQSPSKANIQEIKQEIVLFESLVQNKMTSENVSNLVILLKKAIQYYSAIGSSDFEIYLRKLKTLMSNQMAQALLDSAKQNQNAISHQQNQTQYNKTAFQSIIDMI